MEVAPASPGREGSSQKIRLLSKHLSRGNLLKPLPKKDASGSGSHRANGAGAPAAAAPGGKKKKGGAGGEKVAPIG